MSTIITPKTLPLPLLTAPGTALTPATSLIVKSKGTSLPEIDHANFLLADKQSKPCEIVESGIHAGTKVVVAGGSKVGKTWILLDLATSIASGTPFLRFKTQAAKVLYVNFEIRTEFLADRLRIIQERKQVDLSNLDTWNLRGQSADFDVLADKIIEAARAEKYSVIIIDPIYKAMVGRSENVSSSVSILCNQIERIVEATGAAVVFAHHFTKGNAARKNQIDRMSGSGVFARDADTIITLTEHAEKNCYALEMTLRNLAPQSPFVVEWQFPLMVERVDLSPEDLKSDEEVEENEDEYGPLLSLLEASPLTCLEWQKAAVEIGYSRATFFRDKKVLVDDKRVIEDGGKWSLKQGVIETETVVGK